MGVCFSSQFVDQKPAAKVVSVDGQLRQYYDPVTVSQVLKFESTSPDSFFLCNSDSLDFEEFIPALDKEEMLDSDQIYFVLPRSKLEYRLIASDMAALAVKAGIALDQVSSRTSKSRARISSVLVGEEYPVSNNQARCRIGTQFHSHKNGGEPSLTAGLEVSRYNSLRKMPRVSSRRAKSVLNSFGIRFSPIYEESTQHPKQRI